MRILLIIKVVEQSPGTTSLCEKRRRGKSAANSLLDAATVRATQPCVADALWRLSMHVLQFPSSTEDRAIEVQTLLLLDFLKNSQIADACGSPNDDAVVIGS